MRVMPQLRTQTPGRDADGRSFRAWLAAFIPIVVVVVLAVGMAATPHAISVVNLRAVLVSASITGIVAVYRWPARSRSWSRPSPSLA
jgi:hypothetical protein